MCFGIILEDFWICLRRLFESLFIDSFFRCGLCLIICCSIQDCNTIQQQLLNRLLVE